MEVANADLLWPSGTWRHVTCRFDSAAGELTSLADGLVQSIDFIAQVAGVDDFRIGSLPGQDGAWGQFDEIFFIDSALTDAQVLRVVACGIDGTLCACDRVDLAAYASCGRIDRDCAALPPCNAPPP
jgi:hypothetical protein